MTDNYKKKTTFDSRETHYKRAVHNEQPFYSFIMDVKSD